MITLAVDDRLPTAQQIRDIMIGIDPEGAHWAGDDPEELLGSVKEKKPDIVWLDIEMPGMGGLEVASEIKKSHRIRTSYLLRDFLIMLLMHSGCMSAVM